VLARGQARVADNDACKALRLLREQAQADEAAPVLPEQRDALQLEVGKQQLRHPLHVPRISAAHMRQHASVFW